MSEPTNLGPGCIDAYAGATSMTQDAIRDAVENALLASDIAGETYGSKATRITNAVLTALDGDAVVGACRRALNGLSKIEETRLRDEINAIGGG